MTKIMILMAGMIVGCMAGILLMLVLISLSMRDFWKDGR